MEAAVMALLGGSTLGFLLADGEKARLRYIRAMRRSLERMHEMIRYEQPPLDVLLTQIHLRATPQERQLSALLRACGERMRSSSNPQLLRLFTGASSGVPGYAVLSEADRQAYENLLGELGRTGLEGQIRRIDQAIERLRQLEVEAVSVCAQRVRLIRTLGVTGGAAACLLLL